MQILNGVMAGEIPFATINTTNDPYWHALLWRMAATDTCCDAAREAVCAPNLPTGHRAVGSSALTSPNPFLWATILSLLYSIVVVCVIGQPGPRMVTLVCPFKTTVYPDRPPAGVVISAL